MKAREGVISQLNAVLTVELTAINQYFVHAKMCENWGLLGLGERLREDSLTEMRDAEHLVERILHLEGIPNLQRLGNVKVGQTIPEQLTLALETEQGALQTMNEAFSHCGSVGDFASQRLLAKMIESEEEQIAWLESQLGLIEQVGLQNYLATQIAEEPEAG
jgi:bacterioferritin